MKKTIDLTLKEKISIGVHKDLYANLFCNNDRKKLIFNRFSLDMVDGNFYNNILKDGIDAYVYNKESYLVDFTLETLLRDKLIKNNVFPISTDSIVNPIRWWDTRRRLLGFIWLLKKDITSIKDIYDSWHRLKFICQEVDEKEARGLGYKLAHLSKDTPIEFLLFIKNKLLLILTKESSERKIIHWIKKNHSFLRKSYNLDIYNLDNLYTLDDYEVARSLLAFEESRKDNGILFGSSPIIYLAE